MAPTDQTKNTRAERPPNIRLTCEAELARNLRLDH